MLRLDAIRDPETLRQVAVLLERENDTLHAKLQALTAELARLRGDATLSAQHELEFLKELLAQRERALFGASSERRPRAETTDEHTPPAAPRGHGPAAQPKLPIVEMVHELDAPDQTCPQCGGTLREMRGQTEDSGEVLVKREEPYVEAARALGHRDWVITVTQILPNIISPIVIKATLDVSFVILLGSSLAFLGLGAQEPTPDWGAMVARGRTFLPEHWWLSTMPGLMIFVAVMGFNLLGDALRDALDVWG